MRTLERPPDIIAKVAPSDAIIKNAWYLGAWSHEVAAGTLFPRRIAGEPIVFYRDAGGAIAALLDRCPHRRFPLSAGKLDGDVLQCGYHGFRFDPHGACLSVPGQVKVPAAADVRAFPVVEQFGQIWVYTGNPALADPAKIPHVPWTTEWWSATGHAPLKARASLLLDNLLDLSHESFIHAAGIGTPEVAETPIAVERDGDVLWVRRFMHGVACPPNYQKSTGITGLIDRSQEIQFFAPGFYVLHVRIAEAGDTQSKGFLSKIVYGITPETARTTHNFYGICRDVDRDTARPPFTGQANTVAEDRECLELLERWIVADGDDVPPEVSIGIDRGGLLGRRMLADLLRREAAI